MRHPSVFLPASLVMSALLSLPVSAHAAGRSVAPEFTLTLKDISALALPLPRPIRERIAARPELFLRLLSNVLDEPAAFFVLVDKHHPLAPDDVPPDLVPLDAFPLSVSRGDLRLRKAIMPAVLALDAAARAAGAPLLFSSTYRSNDYQAVVYAREVKTYGREKADRESARPDMSQHQLGTVIDFGPITDSFGATKQGHGSRRTRESTAFHSPILRATSRSRATGQRAGTTATSRRRACSSRGGSSATSSSTCSSSSRHIGRLLESKRLRTR